MFQRKNTFHSVIVGLLVIAISIGSIVFINFRRNSENRSLYVEHLQTPTILYLENSTLHFQCLGIPDCMGDIDLGGKVKEANDPKKHPVSLLSAHRGSDSNLYLLISGSVWNYLIKVDLKTNQAQTLDLNDPSIFGTEFPTFFPGTVRLIHGRMVIATTNGKVGIVQNDFSLKIVDLKVPVFDFIEANDSEIAILSGTSRLMDGASIKLFLIDINSGEIEEKAFNLPKEDNATIVTVDHDIKSIYWVSSNMSLSENALHVFDIQAGHDTGSISIPNIEALTYTTLTFARYQFQGTWYYSRRCCLEGSAPAMIFDMTTLTPRVNPDDILMGELDQTFMVAPLGKNFQIGTNSRVIIIDPNGVVIATYDLPTEWIGRNYLLVEYK